MVYGGYPNSPTLQDTKLLRIDWGHHIVTTLILPWDPSRGSHQDIHKDVTSYRVKIQQSLSLMNDSNFRTQGFQKIDMMSSLGVPYSSRESMIWSRGVVVQIAEPVNLLVVLGGAWPGHMKHSHLWRSSARLLLVDQWTYLAAVKQAII